MICEACFDCPVGTDPVSVLTGVYTTLHAGLLHPWVFLYVLWTQLCSTESMRWTFPWISKGVGCYCSRSLSLQPLAPSFWYSISEFWLCWNPSFLLLLHPLSPRTWLGPPVLLPPASWKSPASKCRHWRSEYMWNGPPAICLSDTVPDQQRFPTIACLSYWWNRFTIYPNFPQTYLVLPKTDLSAPN